MKHKGFQQTTTLNMFESIIKEWNGDTVVISHDQPTGERIFIAIHSTQLGPADGGTRMKSYPAVTIGGGSRYFNPYSVAKII